MTRVTNLTRYKAFRWLWRFDNEAKWFWLHCYLFSKADLKEDVAINLQDFGLTKHGFSRAH